MAMTRREKVQIRSKLLLERWKYYLKVASYTVPADITQTDTWLV